MEPKNYFAADPANLEFGKVEEESVIPADQQAQKPTDDSQPDKLKKRNHDERRWDRLMKEREQDRDVISELSRFKQDVESGRYSNNSGSEVVPEHFKKMYEDGLTVEERWAMQKQYDSQKEEEIIQRAQQAAVEAVSRQAKEQTRWESYIDDQLENLEEKYDVDFTSGSTKAEKLKKDFLKTVAKVSPKDKDGNVSQYASFEDTFEFWSETKGFSKPTDGANIDRKKDLASMGNNRPASVPSVNEPGEGGMWGWKKDIPANG